MLTSCLVPELQKQRILTSALWHAGPHTPLCPEGRLAASGTSTHYLSVAAFHPKLWQPECLQMLPNGPWGGQIAPWMRTTALEGSSEYTGVFGASGPGCLGVRRCGLILVLPLTSCVSMSFPEPHFAQL